MHTDIVVPVRTRQIDWSRLLPYTDTPAADQSRQFIGFGWGDKGFYLDTPTWAELKLSTGLKAMFWLSTTAMHTSFHHRPAPGPDCVRLSLTPAEYARLIHFIQGSFDPGRRRAAPAYYRPQLRPVRRLLRGPANLQPVLYL